MFVLRVIVWGGAMCLTLPCLAQSVPFGPIALRGDEAALTQNNNQNNASAYSEPPILQNAALPPQVSDLSASQPSPKPKPTPKAERKSQPDEDPFTPQGLMFGALQPTPYIEQNIGYSTNPLISSDSHKGSFLSKTEVGVGWQSDWSRNAFNGSLTLGYGLFPQVADANAPYGNGNMSFRYDLSRDMSLDIASQYAVSYENNSQLGLSSSSSLTPVLTYDASLGGQKTFGLFTFGLHGTLDRTEYDTSFLDSNNFTDYGLRLRTDYHESEGIQPFVELGTDARLYDNPYDCHCQNPSPAANGYDHNSQGQTAKLGATLAFSPKLLGEASLGYEARQYQDPLPNIITPLFDASLKWSMTALTDVTLSTQSKLDEAIVPGASVDINRTYMAKLDQALTERIKLSLEGDLSTDRYIGSPEYDHTYTLGLGAEYHLSRTLILKTQVEHQQILSNIAGLSSNADIVFMGLRWQR